MNHRRCYKKAFSLLELIFVIFLISLFSYIFLKPSHVDSLNTVSNRLIIYLKQTRLQAFLEDQYNHEDPLWHKKRWTLKFFRCKKSVGGLYYVIYSDKNETGHPSASESLKDPLSQKWIYSSNSCSQNQANSKYVLLTQMFDITDVNVSCNTTSALGQLSFGSDGKVYSQLSHKEGGFAEYEIKTPCFITMFHKNGTSKQIIVEAQTGYIHKN